MAQPMSRTDAEASPYPGMALALEGHAACRAQSQIRDDASQSSITRIEPDLRPRLQSNLAAGITPPSDSASDTRPVLRLGVHRAVRDLERQAPRAHGSDSGTILSSELDQ